MKKALHRKPRVVVPPIDEALLLRFHPELRELLRNGKRARRTPRLRRSRQSTAKR